MADDPTKRNSPDSKRINIHESHEVKYWTKELGVSEKQLTDAVTKYGTSAEAVRKGLGK
jgi:hypothetical protein